MKKWISLADTQNIQRDTYLQFGWILWHCVREYTIQNIWTKINLASICYSITIYRSWFDSRWASGNLSIISWDFQSYKKLLLINMINVDVTQCLWIATANWHYIIDIPVFFSLLMTCQQHDLSGYMKSKNAWEDCASMFESWWDWDMINSIVI